MRWHLGLGMLFWICQFCSVGVAGVGDPQLGTDHEWYSGELHASSFERLFHTQALLFERMTGRQPRNDEDRALASWMWRNLHYFHGEEGKENLFSTGWNSGDATTREYWTGLYAHGFGLCGTTHAQWTAELRQLLGPGRSRTVGVRGHNSLEVFLTGNAYGSGQWCLLDHDVSTVVFDEQGERLVSIEELRRHLSTLGNPNFRRERQRNWPIGGLHPEDTAAFSEFNVAEHIPGYAGPSPRIHLRRGESLRRYFEPGLEDGKTFVYWGRNYRAGGIPGPERSRTWVNQPDRFLSAREGSGFHVGQARFGNAVYTYRPDFASTDYREGVIEETDSKVVFEFATPFIIAASPATTDDWGIYQSGCTQGMIVHGNGDVPVSISTDRGTSWSEARMLRGSMDLTDLAKGNRQYWLRFDRPAKELKDCGIEIRTVCQANPNMFPRLKSRGSLVRYEASGTALVSAGPNKSQALGSVVDGAMDSPRVTMRLEAPRAMKPVQVYAAAHIASSTPPDPQILYQIEASLDQGKTWNPIVRDWSIHRIGMEPKDAWSQSFCYGDLAVQGLNSISNATGASEFAGPVTVRFRNNGGKRYLRTEMHLAYAVPELDGCRVEFAWRESGAEERRESHDFLPRDSSVWAIDTADRVQMKWVDMSVIQP